MRVLATLMLLSAGCFGGEIVSFAETATVQQSACATGGCAVAPSVVAYESQASACATGASSACAVAPAAACAVAPAASSATVSYAYTASASSNGFHGGSMRRALRRPFRGRVRRALRRPFRGFCQ